MMTVEADEHFPSSANIRIRKRRDSPSKLRTAQGMHADIHPSTAESGTSRGSCAFALSSNEVLLQE
jgi:hypothetical protein